MLVLVLELWWVDSQQDSCSPVGVLRTTELPGDVPLLLILGHPACSASGRPCSSGSPSQVYPILNKCILGCPLHSDRAYCPLGSPEKSVVAALKPTHRLSDGLMRVQWGRLIIYLADKTDLITPSTICVLVS